MAKERCLKKAFQVSLEDIKERMKEMRTKKLSKVATINKGLSTKVKIIQNSSASLKSCQANNKSLALALQAEKLKTRQAQDLILHLKGEHQRLMLEIFVLRRKLSMPQGDSQSDAKLASVKEIIAKASHYLLETVNLLGPALTLCSTDNPSTDTPAVEEKLATPSGMGSNLVESCDLASDTRRQIGNDMVSNAAAEKRNSKEVVSESSKNGPAVKRLSRGRRSSLHQSDENSDSESAPDSNLFKNVSMRRRPSNLNICIEESPVDEILVEQDPFPEPATTAPVEICLDKVSNDDIMDTCLDQSPTKDEIAPFTELSELLSSTPEPKPKPIPKGKSESRPGRDRVKRGKADGGNTVQLKKPWEKPKTRARSKSRERGGSKPAVSKDKMNSSLNSGGAYDFALEESIHVTPFRQNKQSSNAENNIEPEKDGKESSSEEDLDDSLYVPYKEKSRRPSSGQNQTSLPSRPRSKRNKPQLAEKKENISDHAKQDVGKGKKNQTSSKIAAGSGVKEPDERSKNSSSKSAQNEALDQAVDIPVDQDNPVFPTDKNEHEGAIPRISLSDVTNLMSSFSNADGKKRSSSYIRKRRCTGVVNYAEPSLTNSLQSSCARAVLPQLSSQQRRPP
ncbi:shugoshin 1 isoform X2 [Hyperolius riggenbachi]|uniref:shugoshin 1 isoform X2 n=1 Tax=Hyperolius riggenbachi TaxID=752182 RepID=UPI0035A329B6